MKNLKINPFYILVTLLIIFVMKTDVYAYSINTSSRGDEAEDLFITESETAQVFKNYDISNKDIYLMAQVVYAESRGEAFDGKVAVAAVILNRLASDKFPDTISGVIFQANAFSCIKGNKIKMKPDKDSINAVYKALSGADPTSDSTFFYNPSISTSAWINRICKRDSLRIGNHVFFKT